MAPFWFIASCSDSPAGSEPAQSNDTFIEIHGTTQSRVEQETAQVIGLISGRQRIVRFYGILHAPVQS
jgi:hypothetical protein